MASQRVRSYFQLALPDETERYVFRAYAAKLILAEPERYGLQVAGEDLYRPPEWDRLRVRVRRRASVRAIAEASRFGPHSRRAWGRSRRTECAGGREAPLRREYCVWLA